MLLMQELERLSAMTTQRQPPPLQGPGSPPAVLLSETEELSDVDDPSDQEGLLEEMVNLVAKYNR
jgi:hypothetical protein